MVQIMLTSDPKHLSLEAKSYGPYFLKPTLNNHFTKVPQSIDHRLSSGDQREFFYRPINLDKKYKLQYLIMTFSFWEYLWLL